MSKLAQAVQAAVESINDPATEGATTMKAKGQKKERVKKEKAPKAEKSVMEGPITGVKASGETYVQIQFGDQSMTLTPTSNRTKNRDLFVASLRSLLS